MEGPARFTEIRGSVDGLSARLLAERLRELEQAGLMERRELRGGAVEYRLTSKGEALSRVVREIEAWVATWDDEPAAPARPRPRR
jgi:DNA-binding HxlR family transcriptional regulator